MFRKIFLSCLLLLVALPASANLDQQRPENISDQMWSSLQSAVEEAKLLPAPEGVGHSREDLGKAVAIDGDRALVGGREVAGSGAVLVFEYVNDVWVETAVLSASDGRLDDKFSTAVSLAGDWAIVGAPGNNRPGAVYVYEYDGNMWHEREKLTAPVAQDNDYFGYAVSMSGNRILIGDRVYGLAYLYEQVNGAWTNTAELFPSSGGTGQRFGTSVSLEGDRAIIGASYADSEPGYRSGAAYVFDFDGEKWNETSRLTSSDTGSTGFFGSSVALNADRAVVTDPSIDGNAAYVFENSGSGWVEVAKLTPSDWRYNSQFGSSAAIMGDRIVIGDLFAVGDMYGGVGAVYIFEYDGMGWQETQKIIPDDESSNHYFGISVAMQGDRILVGANGGNAAYSFAPSAGTWLQNQKMVAAPGAAQDKFGLSVSLLGNRALVGAYGDDDVAQAAGAAYVYDFDGVAWSLTTKLTASDGAYADLFGWSVSLSADRAFVGAPSFPTQNGGSSAVYVFDFDGINWVETDKLTPSDTGVNEHFGWSLSAQDNRVLIGAYKDSSLAEDSGSAYIFDYDGVQWNETTKFVPFDAQAGDLFGYSVSLSGNWALVGSLLSDGINVDSGAAYIYQFDGLNWNISRKLTAHNGMPFANFGHAVSLSGNKALIGAPGSEFYGNDTASAYVFEYNGIGWSQSAQLMASDRGEYDNFGVAVALDEGRAFVGADKDDIKGKNSGSVYVFELDESTWTESFIITASDGRPYDNFGQISLSGNHLLVGAPEDDDHGTSSGSAFVFDVTRQFDLIGNVEGLAAGNSVVLQNNLQATTSIDSNNTHALFTDISDESNYSIAVLTQPTNPNQTCLVSGGSNGDGTGTINGTDVTNLAVNCSLNQYDINVSVNGLQGDAVTFQNGADALIVDTDGLHTISTREDGTAYNLNITNQPSSPNQSCYFTNADFGSLSGSDVTVTVECVTEQYTVGVEVLGLAPGNSVGINYNGSESLIHTNGGFVYAIPLDDLSAYSVAVVNQPTSPNQTCLVTGGSNGDGTGIIDGADVDDITVTCSTNDYAINLNVMGLTGDSVSFSQGADTLTISNNGVHTISAMPDESAFDVTISDQPESPNQICDFVDSSSGVLAGADVTLGISCTTLQYTVGLDVSGLASGSSLIIQNNLMDDLLVTANGPAVFNTPLDDGTSYVVTVLSHPTTPNQTCEVTGGDNNDGTGVLSGSNVTHVFISCVTNQYTIGMEVAGLADGNTLILQNNGGDDLVVTNNGPQVFSTPQDDGETYAVTVLSQPTTPNQQCQLAQEAGQINGADVTTVVVNCVTDLHSIGGTVTGLASGNSVTLLNNGGEDTLLVSANGDFEFTNEIEDGSAYAVTVLNQPSNPNQTCEVSKGAGILAGADVMDVVISCVTNQYFVGGYVDGLIPDNFMLLHNNGIHDLVINHSGAFVFPTPLADGQAYAVTIHNQPNDPIQNCELSNGLGSLNGDDVDDVIIQCEFGNDLIFRHGLDTPEGLGQ